MSAIVRRMTSTTATVLTSDGDLVTLPLRAALAPRHGDLVDVHEGEIIRVVKRGTVKEVLRG